MDEMSAKEAENAAEIIEDIIAVSNLKAVDGTRSGIVKLPQGDAGRLKLAASLCRKIAAGKYKQVVHGEWVADEFGRKCSACDEYVDDDTYENGCLTYCPSCGAKMGDDNHETR